MGGRVGGGWLAPCLSHQSQPCHGRCQTPGQGHKPRSPSRRLETQGSQCWRHTATRICFLKSTKWLGENKRKKSIYKNLFTYKILKKVQGKTQCEGRAQIRRVCVHLCVSVYDCMYAPVSVCACASLCVPVHVCTCVSVQCQCVPVHVWCIACACVYLCACVVCVSACVCGVSVH